MGELFRCERPDVALAWTGERFVTDIDGDGGIEIERLHRYFVARELCRSKHVLEIACGEGYGSALLTQTAEQVIGVEVDHATVAHASKTYQYSNLQYVQADALCLPLDNESADVVVSFETLERFFNQEGFLKEVKRVLRPVGFLLISTPDASVYSGGGLAPNRAHMRELTKSEFLALLQAEFRNVSLLRQRVIVGSAILPETPTSLPSESWCFERRDANTFEAAKQLQRAPYLLAVASNGENPPIGASIYIRRDALPVSAQTTQAAASAKAAAEEAARLAKALNDAHEETEAIRQQAKASAILEQQQQLVVRRLMQDLSWRAQKAGQCEKQNQILVLELEAARQELAKLREAYDQISHLIVPIWMRKMLPAGLKNRLGAAKRALRHG